MVIVLLFVAFIDVSLLHDWVRTTRARSLSRAKNADVRSPMFSNRVPPLDEEREEERRKTRLEV
jgi:hypothetical protein